MDELAHILRQLVQDYLPAEILSCLGARYCTASQDESHDGLTRVRYAELYLELQRLSEEHRDLETV